MTPLRTAFRSARTSATGVAIFILSLRDFTRGIWSGLVVLMVVGPLGMGTGGVAVLGAAAGVGGVLSLAVTGRVLATRFHTRWLCGSLVVAGALLGLVAALPEPAVAVAALAVWGFCLAIADLAATTLIPRVVDHRSIAGVVALAENAKRILEGIGLAGAALLATAVGVQTAVAAGGVLVAVLAIAAWPTGMRAERQVADRERIVSALAKVPLFAPLRLDALEILADGVREVSAPAGAVLITEGDRGDSYWALLHGTVTARRDGTTPHPMGPGDGFGEVALLHDVPRTATVVAESEITALVIDRDEFLLAVDGPPDLAPDPD